MSLKQIKPQDRIIFLKLFMKEVMINLERQKPSKQIEIEKLKQKFLQPIDSPEKTFRKAINTSFFQEPIYSREMESKPLPIKSKPQLIESKPQIIKKKRQLWHRIQIPRRRLQIKRPPLKKPLEKVSLVSPKAPLIQLKALTSIKPEPQKRPEGFALGKLELLLKDVSIQSIECPGSGRNVLVKKHNKINVTKIILSQTEIKEVINSFSEKARIPIVGGILKAAVGDLVMSAVISDFVGSRFIINKMTPYSLIEK